MRKTVGKKFILIPKEDDGINRRNVYEFFEIMRYYDMAMYNELVAEFGPQLELLDWEYSSEVETGDWLERKGISLRYVMYPEEGGSPYFQIWRN